MESTDALNLDDFSLPLPGILPLQLKDTALSSESESESEITALDEGSTSTAKADGESTSWTEDKNKSANFVDELTLPTIAMTSSELSAEEEKQRVIKDLKSRRELEEEEREKMQVLVSNFTENQLDRYEMYRRAAFPKAAIKRLMQTITGNSVAQNVIIAMSGIAKVFVGEIVEEALDVMDKGSETGPVQPKHVREAVRKLRQRGLMPNSKTRRYTPYPL